ncbi:hypothetical protein GA0115249_101723 [Streptomyces sp. PpalLS-921]|nr:hypothetical protein GA0115249_101723 [Streptomyces sp. PpalLS-921]
MLEKWPRKPSMWAHFHSLRSAYSGRWPRFQAVRIICRTCRWTGRDPIGSVCPVPSQSGPRTCPRPAQGRHNRVRSTVPAPSAFLVAYLATYPATLASVSSPSLRAGVGSTTYRSLQAMTRSPMASETRVRRARSTARPTATRRASKVAQGGGGGGAAVRPVEADHGMEVDQAPLLVFGRLGEGDAEHGVEGLLRHAEVLGQGPSQVGGEARPELSGVRVPEDGSGVAATGGSSRRRRHR